MAIDPASLGIRLAGKVAQSLRIGLTFADAGPTLHAICSIGAGVLDYCLQY